MVGATVLVEGVCRTAKIVKHYGNLETKPESLFLWKIVNCRQWALGASTQEIANEITFEP